MQGSIDFNFDRILIIKNTVNNDIPVFFLKIDRNRVDFHCLDSFFLKHYCKLFRFAHINYERRYKCIGEFCMLSDFGIFLLPHYR
ncbi:hypothetical protein D3C77_521790 [compost metagenome]